MDFCLNIVVILNFLVKFLLILGTNCICGYPIGMKRAAAASMLGALFSAGCLIPGFSFLNSIFWRMVCFVMVSVVAFGWHMRALQRGIIFVFLSMALDGIAIGAGEGSVWSVLFGALVLCLMCLLGFGGRPGGQRYLPVTISHRGKMVQLTALVDTGNTLRDPVSTLPVLVVDADTAKKLLCLTEEQLCGPIETIASGRYPGLRLIPYHAVGQSAGLLLGLRVDRLVLNGKPVEMIVAFAPQRIGQGKAYQALAGGYV